MSIALPEFTALDPVQSSEGNLDPMGLYQIADQLAVGLIPAVRERMSRIRFLTAMTVGAVVREGLPPTAQDGATNSYLAWEWLVVESIVKTYRDDPDMRGVPGSMMTRRALDQHGYLDEKSYLKTPRIFGFHGIYKRLAMHLGIVDPLLNPGSAAGHLLDAWAKDQGYDGFNATKSMILKWGDALRRCLDRADPATWPVKWTLESWGELASTLYPNDIGRRERRVLRELLLDRGEHRLGAFADVWILLESMDAEKAGDEREVHQVLAATAPEWAGLVRAIGAYEAFARTLQDAFDGIRFAAQRTGGRSFALEHLGDSPSFVSRPNDLSECFARAAEALESGGSVSVSAAGIFQDRFGVFASPAATVELGRRILSHHETIQRGKSAEGKRPWFERLGDTSIYLRLPYHLPADWDSKPGKYLHTYRTGSVASFQEDLQ